MSRELEPNNEEQSNEETTAPAVEQEKVEPKGAQESTPVKKVQDSSSPEGEIPDWVLKERKELRDEAAKYRVRAREVEETYKDGLTAKEVEALKAEHNAQLTEVYRGIAADRVGLREELRSRITGSTLEEMLADAQLLAGGRGTPAAKGAGLTPGGSHEADIDPHEAAKQAWLRSRRLA